MSLYVNPLLLKVVHVIASGIPGESYANTGKGSDPEESVRFILNSGVYGSSILRHTCSS